MDKLRGYNIIKKDGEWIFEDTKKPTVETWKKRPCGYCNKHNTIKDHDGCLGTLLGVMNACCGHGVERDAYIQFLDRKTIHGTEALVIINKLK